MSAKEEIISEEKKGRKHCIPSEKKSSQTKSEEGRGEKGRKQDILRCKQNAEKKRFFKGKERKFIEEKFSGRQYTFGWKTKKCHGTCSTRYEKGTNFVARPSSEYFWHTYRKSFSPRILLVKKYHWYYRESNGGGVNAQSEAVRHGIARALVIHNAEWRPLLKKQDCHTRCRRVKRAKETRTQTSSKSTPSGKKR